MKLLQGAGFQAVIHDLRHVGKLIHSSRLGDFNRGSQSERGGEFSID